MEDEKKNESGCGCGQCHCPETTAPNVGETLAHDAIHEMGACKGKVKGSASLDADDMNASADAFLAECDKNEADPLDVIAHIAKKEDIALLGSEPDDPDKRRVYVLLRAVVRRLVTNFADYIANTYDLGEGSLFDVLGMEPPEKRTPVRNLCTENVHVRIIPLRMRYAFSI